MLHRGRVEQGLALVDEAVANPRWPGMLAPMYEAMCDLLAEAGDWARAHEEAPKMRSYAERGGFLTMPFAVDRLEGRAALAAGDRERAAELLARSAAGFSEYKVVWEESRSLVLLAEALLEIGRNDQAADALHRAESTFERLGAPRERARASELLASIG